MAEAQRIVVKGETDEGPVLAGEEGAHRRAGAAAPAPAIERGALIGLLVALPAVTWLMLSLSASGPTLVADASELLFRAPQPGAIVQFESNAVLRVALSPVLTFIAGPAGLAGYVILLQLIIAGGLVWVVARLRAEQAGGHGMVPHPIGYREAALVTVLLSALLLGAGADLRLLTSVGCLALSAGAALSVLGSAGTARARWGTILILLVVLTFSLVGAGVVTVSLAAMLFALFAARSRFPAPFEPGMASFRYDCRMLLLVAGLLLPVLLAELGGAIQLPEYPEKGHLVPGYGVVDGIRPLLGSETPHPLINRSVLRASWTAPALLLALLCLVGLYSGRSSPVPEALRLVSPLLAVLAFCAVLDTMVLPIELSQLAPLQGFARMFPEQSQLPLLPDLTIYCALLLGAAALAAAGPQLSTVIVLGIMLVLNLRGEAPGELGWAASRRAAMLKPWAAASVAGTTRIANSPSYHVMSSPLWTGTCPSQLAYLPASKVEGVQLSASSGESSLRALSDGSPATRWSAGVGKQRKGEWLRAGVAAPRRIRGIRLATGSFYTDFPRGVRVRMLADCTSGKVIWERDVTPWEGEIKCTSAGYPFFAEQYDVAVELPADLEAQCVEIGLSQDEPRFDWSVAELQLALDN